MLRLTVVLALAAGSLGCAGSWRVDPAGPVATVTERRPTTIRVTSSDSSRVEVTKPAIRGDSVVGYSYSAMTQGMRPVAIPLGGIALLEYRHGGGGDTAALIGVGILVASVIGLALGGGPPSSF